MKSGVLFLLVTWLNVHVVRHDRLAAVKWLHRPRGAGSAGHVRCIRSVWRGHFVHCPDQPLWRRAVPSTTTTTGRSKLSQDFAASRRQFLQHLAVLRCSQDAVAWVAREIPCTVDRSIVLAAGAVEGDAALTHIPRLFGNAKVKQRAWGGAVLWSCCKHGGDDVIKMQRA